MLKKRLLILLIAILLLAATLIAHAGTVQLPKTGQTDCWDTGGNTIACAGTGQDGDLQKGVAWPTSPSRFINNNDGTVTDNLTGFKMPIVSAASHGAMPWLKAMPWQAARVVSMTVPWPVTGDSRTVKSS